MSNRTLTSEDLTTGFVYAGPAGETLLPYRGIFTHTDGTAKYADSGYIVGVTVQGHVSGDPVSAKKRGRCLMELNAVSVGISPGDPIKLTTDGVGVKGATDKNTIVARFAEDTAIATDGYIGLVELEDFTLSA